MSETKDCPFCHKTIHDKDPETFESCVVSTKYVHGETISCVVQCNWCGLSGPLFETVDLAIEAWNKLPRS